MVVQERGVRTRSTIEVAVQVDVTALFDAAPSTRASGETRSRSPPPSLGNSARPQSVATLSWSSFRVKATHCA